MILGFGLLIAVAAVITAFVAGAPEKPEPQTARKNAQQTAMPAAPLPAGSRILSARPNAAVPHTEYRSPPASVATPESPAPTSKEAIAAAIHEASITYDAKELPKIQPYLLHPDPEIREAALNGMLVLGDAAASPLLRAAAKQIASPEEAAKMLEAAGYLELPSASLRSPGHARPLSRPGMPKAGVEGK